jgi:hypothetical protein
MFPFITDVVKFHGYNTVQHLVFQCLKYYSEDGTAYPSGASEFIHGFIGVLVAQSFVFCVVFCRLLLKSMER